MQTRQQLHEEYTRRQANFSRQAEAYRNRYQRFTLVRLVVFLAGIGALFLLFDWHWLAGTIGTLAFLAGFYRFVTWHVALKKAQHHHEALATINAREIEALDLSCTAYADGADFLDEGHPNALDLDLFGPHAFFPFVNRTTTALGQQRLATWLTTTAEPDLIARRQEAITELKNHLDWRQEALATGLETEDQADALDLLLTWMQQPSVVLHKSWVKIVLVVMPILTIAALAYCIPYQPWYVSLLCVVPNILILRPFRENVDRIHLQTTKAEAMLKDYAALLEAMEKAPTWSTSLNQELQHRLQGAASQAIGRLSYLINQLNTRYNVFAIFLNLLGLWDLQWIYRLEKWKVRYRDQLPEWFAAMAQFETLNSFANLYYNHPDWCLPHIDEGAQLRAEQLGHPLLHPEQRVCNDLGMPTAGHIKLITGSNMAGKSTFLRTVGLNIVLAMAGAPVCARSLRLPPLEVYSSMRTQDALHESTSSFYAELKRLKFIIEAVEAGHPVFFLLDEILKGTNSNDRHTGSKALIRQLIHHKGAGLIATHDLELGALEAHYGGAIENLCMEVEIVGDELYFDYQLKKGVSQSFNATLLMQKMGIRINQEEPS